MFENLLTHTESGIHHIIINRAGKLNALNRDTLAELHTALYDAYNNDNVGGIIITGAGDRAFVAGADIAEFASFDAVKGEELARRGHKNVFDYIENNTLNVAIDALLFNISHLVATYFVQPCIISQTDVSCVSNVQHDHDIVSPLLLENPTLDKKVVYNNEISTNDKKSKIDLFDNICMRQSDGLGVNMSMPMKSLSEIYKAFPVLLTESDV